VTLEIIACTTKKCTLVLLEICMGILGLQPVNSMHVDKIIEVKAGRRLLAELRRAASDEILQGNVVLEIRNNSCRQLMSAHSDNLQQTEAGGVEITLTGMDIEVVSAMPIVGAIAIRGTARQIANAIALEQVTSATLDSPFTRAPSRIP